ncbi:MAG TPA: NAD(P)/FAD-dependent oxidoreductase [Chthoniobacterales bacterium]|jgi:flavin-dependent dehydrogenase|nr:NAD(P)/FAD-dependent oxidoreductase [Chthoniobacterales bacterium]
MSGEIYDVAIIGGGPAGSVAAALLARAGRRVIVLERDKFPRFHIGESLLPFSMQAFTRLGLHEKFARAGFMEKFGGEMYGACGDEGVKFYFEDGFRSQTDRSYQVTRADFDKVLLDHAAESGAEVREETGVDNIEFSDDGATVTIRGRAEERPSEISARYVIDASGRNSILSAKFKLKKNYEHLQKVSIFAHYDGMIRAEGRDGTLTRMVRAIDRWFWVIPLSATRTSVGVVLDGSVYKQSGLSAEEFLQQSIEEQPLLMQQMRDAERATPVRTAADFSYRSTQLTGDRWMLAGDAAGFIDPVFSSGVFLAVLGGEQVADVLHEVLDHPNKRRKLFTRYERNINKAMDVYLRFVDAWYSKEFIEVFLHPQDLFQIPPAVNAVLGGNIGDSFAIKWRMWIFYLLVRLQKYFALCPRRTLVPKKEGAPAEGEALEAVL